MPQNPLYRLGANFELLTSPGGAFTALAISSPTLLKAGPGRVCRVSVLTAGSSPGTINNSATVGGVATSNQIAVIPNTAGVYAIDMTFAAGLVITPGTSQTLSVSYL